MKSAAVKMRNIPYILGEEAREVVARAIRDHCEIKQWMLLALNVRTTQAHVVVNCHGAASPELAMAQFKAWGTRRLIAAGLLNHGQSVWTDHGSTRWINTPFSLEQAIDYVVNGQ